MRSSGTRGIATSRTNILLLGVCAFIVTVAATLPAARAAHDGNALPNLEVTLPQTFTQNAVGAIASLIAKEVQRVRVPDVSVSVGAYAVRVTALGVSELEFDAAATSVRYSDAQAPPPVVVTASMRVSKLVASANVTITANDTAVNGDAGVRQVLLNSTQITLTDEGLSFAYTFAVARAAANSGLLLTAQNFTLDKGDTDVDVALDSALQRRVVDQIVNKAIDAAWAKVHDAVSAAIEAVLQRVNNLLARGTVLPLAPIGAALNLALTDDPRVAGDGDSARLTLAFNGTFSALPKRDHETLEIGGDFWQRVAAAVAEHVAGAHSAFAFASAQPASFVLRDGFFTSLVQSLLAYRDVELNIAFNQVMSPTVAISTYTLLPVFPAFSAYLSDPRGIAISTRFLSADTFGVRIFAQNKTVEVYGDVDESLYVGNFEDLYLQGVNMTFALSLTGTLYEGALTLQNNRFALSNLRIAPEYVEEGKVDLAAIPKALPFLLGFASENINGNYLYLHPINLKGVLAPLAALNADLRFGDGYLELLLG